MPRKSPSLSLGAAATRRLLAPVRRAGAALARAYPGESLGRQPVHTVYGGAQLFRADSVPKLGALALQAFAEHAPSPGSLAAAVGLETAEGRPAAAFAADDPRARQGQARARAGRGLPHRLRGRLRQPPRRRGGRARARRRRRGRARHARTARCRPSSASASSRCRRSCRARAAHARPVRDRAACAKRGALPPSFVVTLPKITMPEQVTALARRARRARARARPRRRARSGSS